MRLGELYSERKEKGLAGLPVMSVTLDRGLVLRSSLERRVESELKPADHALVREGDLVYNMMRMWQGASGVASVDCVVSPAYVVAKPNEWLLPAFAGYLLKAPQIIRLLYSYSQGITRDRLRLYFDNFVEVPIPLPPLPEQQKIADILCSVDDAIAAARKVIEQTKRVKQGLLQALMTRGIGHTRFKKTEIGEIPEEWSVRKVESFARVVSGATPSRTESAYFDEGDIPWVKTLDLHGGWITGTDEQITKRALRETSCKMLPEGTVLCAMYGGFRQIGRTGVLAVPGTTNQAISAMVVEQGEAVLPAFLNYFFVAHRPRWRRIAASSRKDPNITRQDVAAFRVAVPPIKEQTAIVDRLNEVSATIRSSEDQRELQIRLKQGLLQDLFTGRVRVPLD